MFSRNGEYGHMEAGHQFGSAAEGSSYHDKYHKAETVYWNEKGLKITRFRILTDMDFPAFDVSYCHGMLNGKPVNVELPFDQFPKRGWKAYIVKEAIRDKVYAKGLGIFENVSAIG
jgi:hypothetical protein